MGEVLVGGLPRLGEASDVDAVLDSCKGIDLLQKLPQVSVQGPICIKQEDRKGRPTPAYLLAGQPPGPAALRRLTILHFEDRQ